MNVLKVNSISIIHGVRAAAANPDPTRATDGHAMLSITGIILDKTKRTSDLNAL